MSTLDTPLTKQEMLQSLLHVQLVEDQGSDEPTPHQRRTTRRLHRNQSQRQVGSPAHGVRATTPTPRKAHRLGTQRSATSEWPRSRQRISLPAQPPKLRHLHHQRSAEAGVAPEDPGSPVRGTAYWKLQFHKNASIIATYTRMCLGGIHSARTLTTTCASRIRELLLQRAHYAWWTQRELITTDSAKAPMTRSYKRRRKTSTSTHNNPKTSGRAGKRRLESIARKCGSKTKQSRAATTNGGGNCDCRCDNWQPSINSNRATTFNERKGQSEAPGASSMIDTSTSRHLRSEIAVVGAPRPRPRGIQTREDDS